MSNPSYVVGVDVGTTSARAAVIEVSTGQIIASHSHPIQIFHPQSNFYQHSSTDIWSSVCTSVNSALLLASSRNSLIRPSSIKALAFDATCSLVVLGENDEPISVSPDGAKEQDVIVWMDHRAQAEADLINGTRHELLKYVGGQISVEMELPKLLWLKNHMPEAFNKAKKFFDLADFLSYKATGRDVRSLCTVTCKWNHLAHLHDTDSRSDDVDHGWSKTFFQQIGLGELVTEKFTRIGEGHYCHQISTPIGDGLTSHAAEQLGLLPSTTVGVGIIDAHAGGIGVLGGRTADEVSAGKEAELSGTVAMICGTSTCHMAALKEPTFRAGIWGPYWNAMAPDMWLLEGGQSAVGSLLDHVIDSHSQGVELRGRAKEKGVSVHDILYTELLTMQHHSNLSSFHLLTSSLHVLPYHHGSRSPRADFTLLGAYSGLTLGSSLSSLALLYLATLQSLCYADRHILSNLSTPSAPLHRAILCGGLSKSALFQQCEADVLQGMGVEVAVVEGEVDAMLLGSGMIAAAACGEWGGLRGAMNGMAGRLRIVKGVERGGEVERFHERKYAVFMQMYDDQMRYRRIMQGSNNVQNL